MSFDAVASIMNKPPSVDDGPKIPLEHLDYEYIRNSKDSKYLERILRVLR